MSAPTVDELAEPTELFLNCNLNPFVPNVRPDVSFGIQIFSLVSPNEDGVSAVPSMKFISVI